MASAQQSGLSSDRVRDSDGVNIDYLLCLICQEILWKPVACQTCETPFCSGCINRWLDNQPEKCPNRCPTYTERRCPPSIAKMLGELKIACINQPRGCLQAIPYEALERHQADCGYQPQQCSACRSQILKKDVTNHMANCPATEFTCEGCKRVYKRGDATTRHTENICLREQLRQMREESNENARQIQRLTRQLNETHGRDRTSQNVTITFDELPHAGDKCESVPDMYRGLRWTKIWYMHLSFATQRYMTSGYVTFFKPGSNSHIVYFRDGAAIDSQPTKEKFTLISLKACTAWQDGLRLTIKGYRNSTQANTHTAPLLFGKPQQISLDWHSIDKVTFEPLDGTTHPGTTDGGNFVIISELTIGPLD